MSLFNLWKKNKSQTAPKINEVDDIKEYPDEARRQIDLFYNHIHRKDWADNDYQGEEPPQDTKKRDAFLAKHGMRKLPNTSPEDSPHLVADHLDKYHHHYPEIAKRYNMKPMTADNSKASIRKSNINTAIYKAKRTISRTLSGQKKPQSQIEVLDKGDGSEPLVRIKKGSEFEKWMLKSGERHDKEVQKYHADNPDFHRLTGSQVYGHYYVDAGNRGGMITPMKRKDFEPRWDKINKK